MAENKIRDEEGFYLHANSVNAAQGYLKQWAANGLAKEMDSIVYHLQCEILILKREIERLKEQMNCGGVNS